MTPPVIFYNNINEKLKPRGKTAYPKGSAKHRFRVLSTENFDLRGWSIIFGQIDIDKVFMIIRDPINWAASSLKIGGYLSDLYGTGQSDAMRKFGYADYFCGTLNRIEMYKQYLREIIDPPFWINQNVVGIDYNYWLIHGEYRQWLAQQNDFVDTGVPPMSKFGGGSSFDTFAPMRRWVDVPEAEEYVDEEMKELYLKFTEEISIEVGLSS
jgi:hypothetical protein